MHFRRLELFKQVRRLLPFVAGRAAYAKPYRRGVADNRIVGREARSLEKEQHGCVSFFSGYPWFFGFKWKTRGLPPFVGPLERATLTSCLFNFRSRLLCHFRPASPNLREVFGFFFINPRALSKQALAIFLSWNQRKVSGKCLADSIGHPTRDPSHTDPRQTRCESSWLEHTQRMVAISHVQRFSNSNVPLITPLHRKSDFPNVMLNPCHTQSNLSGGS